MAIAGYSKYYSFTVKETLQCYYVKCNIKNSKYQKWQKWITCTNFA